MTAKRDGRVITPGRVLEEATRTLHLRGIRVWVVALRDTESPLDKAKLEYFDLSVEEANAYLS